MQVATVLVLILTCELCLTIRVPSSWDESASEVKQEIRNDNDEQFSVESFKPQNVNQNPIPVEYFEYTAKKPQFAVDVAKLHGVQSPESHYKAYPIKPYTGHLRPELGKHQILDEYDSLHRPLQEFANINEDVNTHAVPVSSNYEVFHPYEAETPALQEIYKDPVLSKIRNDLENSKYRLQAYEKDAREPKISKDEYLESPQKTDSKFTPHRNIPARYEIHRSQRRPIYYSPAPILHQREHHLNKRLRHPWNQYSAKIRPINYKPIKNHIHQLRQNHALKYDDERNEYPQVHVLENYSDPKDGYDIYEKGKDKFAQLRNNLDESINKAVKENRPTTYDKLEVQSNDYKNEDDDSDEEFVPIKNYAQVRKTETYKHLPRSAALADAESFDELRNAPRLREAVKSTKAQTVYSEEGYEDAAYDHAGEQKHASENEGHGGFLKQHELSGGKYKTPSESAKYQDGGGSAFRDQLIHAEKWKDDNKDEKEEIDEDDYSEDEHEKLIEGDVYQDSSQEDGVYRNKRENYVKNDTKIDSSHLIHRYQTNDSDLVEKKRTEFKVPELDLNSTFLSEKDILNIAKIKNEQKKGNHITQKYPYYHEKIRAISKNSPLRYAESLESIPRKSNGGTEFYDSRSNFECPEVDDAPDPIPEKLKTDGHPDDNDDDDKSNSSKKGDENYDTVKKTPRLKGLGDKIDCFKAKYFGENPLDSPFFKEEIISNPEPITPPNKLGLHHFKKSLQGTKPIKVISETIILDKEKSIANPDNDVFDKIKKLRNEKSVLRESEKKMSYDSDDTKNLNSTKHIQLKGQSVYTDILNNIKHSGSIGQHVFDKEKINKVLTNNTINQLSNNVTYVSYNNKEDITKAPHVLKKRSATFVYEPYKIIRESQIPDSTKITTTNNISPLIRKLQSSRVVDKVGIAGQEIDRTEKHVKRNVKTPKMYKDIGRKDRELYGNKNDKGSVDTTFIDVSVDKRRGEPRYEIRRPVNHKTSYSPVENKKSMSIEDYKAHRNSDTNLKGENSGPARQSKKTIVVATPSNFDIQNIAESSNAIQKTISTTTSNPKQHDKKSDENRDDYEEYDENEEEDNDEILTTTTTTSKPSFRRRNRPSTTTEQTSEGTESPKLKLVTRFRDYKPDESTEIDENSTQRSHTSNHKVTKGHEVMNNPVEAPKYREKKKKSTKSTTVTDTKRYGDDDDDMRREEIDSLIGVKQDMDDYIPLYEKDEENKSKKKESPKESSENVKKQTKDDEKDDETNEDDDDDYDDDDVSREDDDDEDEEEEEEEEDEEDEGIQQKSEITTPEPTKRTLDMTTDPPSPTIATRNAKLEAKPIVTRKKIEIHKELPANKSAPHTTAYKQDIKEVEIIKEIPKVSKKKTQKDLEALELYKDDNLAKDINKLGGVDIFKENIDLKNGPKHGGNYRRVEELKKSAPLKEEPNKDAIASQSEFTKHVELEDDVPRNRMHGGNLKSLTDIQKSRTRTRSEKIIELSDTPSTSMHGGNLKSRPRGRPSGKNQKLVELDDDNDRDDDNSSNDSHESFSSSRSSRPLHGGNYRSANIVAKQKNVPESLDEGNTSRERGARRNAAAILNSFVQAVPILTTTPAYILDPSKRMYYYVDT